MQRMRPITSLAHGPVGPMKRLLPSDHQACRGRWLGDTPIEKHTRYCTHKLVRLVMLFGLCASLGNECSLF